jgi:hypothetical protein
MEVTEVQRGPWRTPVWRLVGFVAGQAVAGGSPQRLPVHRDAGQVQWLWTGLSAGELVPFSVTADYDEAGAHMEADDQVFSAALPPELYVQLEAFVMQHYRPQVPGKRKRAKWTETEADVWKPSPRLARR